MEMKAAKKVLHLFTILLAILVSISSVLPVFATGEEEGDLLGEETPVEPQETEETPIPVEEEVPPTEEETPTPTEEEVPTEEPHYFDLKDNLVGLKEETYHTTIQFGEQESGLVKYEKGTNEYKLSGFNADEIPLTLNLYWNLPEEFVNEEYTGLLYHLPENINWNLDSITIYDTENNPLEENTVATVDTNILYLNDASVTHLSMNGSVSALELEEKEVIEETPEETDTTSDEVKPEEVEEPKEEISEETVVETVVTSIVFDGIGQVDLERTKEHTIVKKMMMLRGPLLGDPPPVDPIESVNVNEYLTGRQDNPGLYTYIRFGSQTFVLPKRVENPTQELNKQIDKLDENPREVEVNLVWNIKMDDFPHEGEGISENTRFHYTLPDGIKWEWDDFKGDELIIYNTKNPTQRVGRFEVDVPSNTISAYYDEAFLMMAKSSHNTSFTTFVNIKGSVTEADWDDTGDQPYHFEGVGKFDPLREEATASIKVAKNLMTSGGKIDDLKYLGDGRYKLKYQTSVTATFRTKDPRSDKTIYNVNIADTFDAHLSIPDESFANFKLYNSDGTDITSTRLQSCTVATDQKSFTCKVDKMKVNELDSEAISNKYNLQYYVVLDLNATLPTDNEGALSDMVRRFENDVDVTANNPDSSQPPLTDSSVTVDTYTMQNPGKKGDRDDKGGHPDQVKWTINYNEGKFAKDSGTWGGIDISNTFVKDDMGEEQELVPGSFKVKTSTDGGNTWDEWTVTGDVDSGMTVSKGGQSFSITWSDTLPDDGANVKNHFEFTLPDPFYDLLRIEYTSQSTNPYTLVKLTNRASIASDPDGKDEKTGDGDAPGVGPGTVPLVEKKGDELGPNGNFEWTSDLTVHEGYSRNVRYYDAMEKGLELLDSQYPIEVYRVKIEDGVETETLIPSSEWTLVKGTPKYDHIKNKVNPTDEPNNPWLVADLEDEHYSYNWYIEFKGDPANDNILPADGYEFEGGVAKDTKAVYRIKYITNAPMPEKDPVTGDYKTRKYYNEGQIRTKIDDKSDEKDRYNSSDAELEKKYIEKASNDSQYENVTGTPVDSTHGYIGWMVRVYPLEAQNFIEVRDDFTYSNPNTSMNLVDGSVHVYVSTNKNLPSSSEEIAASNYTISNNSTSGFTLRINNPGRAGITKDSFIYVFYQTRVNPRVNNTYMVYTNTASINRDGDTNYPPAKATRSRTDIVVKKGSNRNGQFVTYTLEINKQKLKIDPKKGVLTIEDTRGESIEYVEGSMQFFDGENDPGCTTPLTGSPYSVSSTGKTLEITIPDEMYVIIKYTAIVTKKDGDLSGDDAMNRVVIKGQTGFSAENRLKGRVQQARAGAHIDDDYPWIKVVKYANEDHTKMLKDVTFKFTAYEVDLETGELTPIDGEVYELQTNQDGVIYFTYNQELEIITYFDVVYKVEEIKAPKGYDLDKTVHYVLFTNTPELYEETEVFTLNGKPVEVLIEATQFLHRVDYPNVLTPPPTPTPKRNKVIVPVPDTGDTFHVGMWIGILAGAVVLMFLLLLYLRKNRKQ